MDWIYFAWVYLIRSTLTGWFLYSPWIPMTSISPGLLILLGQIPEGRHVILERRKVYCEMSQWWMLSVHHLQYALTLGRRKTISGLGRFTCVSRLFVLGVNTSIGSFIGNTGKQCNCTFLRELECLCGIGGAPRGNGATQYTRLGVGSGGRYTTRIEAHSKRGLVRAGHSDGRGTFILCCWGCLQSRWLGNQKHNNGEESEFEHDNLGLVELMDRALVSELSICDRLKIKRTALGKSAECMCVGVWAFLDVGDTSY